MNFCKKWRNLAILAAYQLRGYIFAGQIQRFRFGILVGRYHVSIWDTDVWGNYWAVWPQIWILPPQIHNRHPSERRMRTVIATRIMTRRVGRHSSEWECLQHRSVVQAQMQHAVSEGEHFGDIGCYVSLCPRQSAMDFWCEVSKVLLRYFWQK